MQVPKGAQLAVLARLHVEARKKIALVFYRNYFRTSRPMVYILRGGSGEPISPESLSDGSEIVLRQPGVLYADEHNSSSRIESKTFGQIDVGATGAMLADDISQKPHDQGQDTEPFAPRSYYQKGIQSTSLIAELDRMVWLLNDGYPTREEFDRLKERLIRGL